MGVSGKRYGPVLHSNPETKKPEAKTSAIQGVGFGLGCLGFRV